MTGNAANDTATETAPTPATTATTFDLSSVPALVIAKADAMRHLAGQLEDAMQVRNVRIRTSTALDSARELKLRWCQRTHETLAAIFGDETFAEQALAWVGKILPEYADLGLFIEQFQEEMDQHVARTKAILKAVQKMPDPAAKSVAETSAGPQVQGRAITAPVLVEKSAKEQGAETPAGTEARPAEGAKPARASEHRERKSNHHHQSKQSSSHQQEYQHMINGMMLIHGDCGDAVAQVGGFVKPLGITMVSANSDAPGEGAQPAAATMAAHNDLSFALVLDSDAPPPDPAHDSCNGLSFDLGYCVGRLGLGRVFVLQPRASQAFTDRHGIAHLPLDSAGGWQLQLARHLKRGGIEIDLNKLC